MKYLALLVAFISFNVAAEVEFAEHPTDAAKLRVVITLDRAVLTPALDRAARESTPKLVARYRAEDLALNAASEAVAQARAAVQAAETRELAGQSKAQVRTEAEAKIRAEVDAKLAAEPKGDTVAAVVEAAKE